MHSDLTLALDEPGLARQIIDAAPGRDGAAEAELCRRFAPRIRLYGRRHLRDDAAASDLTQDVLLLVLQKLRAGAVHEPDRIVSFVLGTCRQKVIDGRRGTHRREELLETFGADLTSHIADLSSDLDGDVDASHNGRLKECLHRLPDRERTVLVMTFYDNRPAEAVGSELGLSPGNVRVIRHRGLERLRACLRVSEVPS